MSIPDNLKQLRQAIDAAAEKYHRLRGSVKLLAVSKQHRIEKIRMAYAAGQTCFGENYLQEALPKIAALQDLAIAWHFIGRIQSNKTAQIAAHFSWVHSVDRLSIAQRLDVQRPAHLPPLNICLEVNVSAQETKAGLPPEKVEALAHAILPLKNIRVRGLMAIPKPTSLFAEQVRCYQQVQEIQQRLCAQGLELDTLSMGMSGDFIAAIAAGSTLVRLGTAIFGQRNSF
jgi:pyridoxal phosphate enzyme (YggS family)